MNWPKMLAQAIFLSSIQASIGSVEMSSRFSVMNFSKEQEILDNASSALKSYLFIAGMWTLATVLVMWSQYGLIGAITGFLSNLGYILWIYFSYQNAFKYAADKYGLQMPRVF